eukprot:COSAG02_NODE_4688_length_5091_cov_8.316185_1_plen_157_part_00
MLLCSASPFCCTSQRALEFDLTVFLNWLSLYLSLWVHAQGAYLTIAGRDYLNFCSSHYLGFAEEPRLKQAAQDAIAKYGLGTGYRTLSGTHALHVELEEKIAHFKGTEAAVTFSSAYAANASAIQTILVRGSCRLPPEHHQTGSLWVYSTHRCVLL